MKRFTFCVPALLVVGLTVPSCTPEPPPPTKVDIVLPQAPLLIAGSAEAAGCQGPPPKSVSFSVIVNATLTPANARPPEVDFIVQRSPEFTLGMPSRRLAQGDNSVPLVFTPQGLGGPVFGDFKVDLGGVLAVGPNTFRLLGLGTCKGLDSDGDGIRDAIEDKNNDGVTDADETSATKPDTDDDGIIDGFEDQNRNGRVDTGESNPRDRDTDHDQILDGVEDANKNGKRDLPTETKADDDDTDDDNISDGTEDLDKNGIVGQGETDPRNDDSDKDGIPDGVEDKNRNGQVDTGESDPRDDDSDDDRVLDGNEDRNKNGIRDPGETSPANPDTDGDGIPDGEDPTPAPVGP